MMPFVNILVLMIVLVVLYVILTEMDDGVRCRKTSPNPVSEIHEVK